jgi:DNA-directed RNA polymerase specialized sigma24 family protein
MVLTWVNAIALNIYRRAVQRERFRQPLPELYSRLEIDLAAIDVASVLKSCLPRERRLLEQQLRGVTAKELAQDSGVTETAIRLRLLRARRAARAWVEGERVHLRRAAAGGN